MPPEGRAELAHAEAAGWALGNLDPAEAEEFGHHLPTCRHCQAAVAEFSAISQALRHLPPAVEPPPELEDRTIAGVLAAVAQDRQAPQGRQSSAGPDLPGADAGAKVIRFPRWRGRVGLLVAAAVAAAAGVIAIALLTLPGAKPAKPVHGVTVAYFALHSPSGGPVVGRAVGTDHGPGGWSFRLSVHGLRPLPTNQFYECWYAASPRGHPKVSGGTFTLGSNDAGTFTMWTAADPRMFKTMLITRRKFGEARSGTVVLTAQVRLSQSGS